MNNVYITFRLFAIGSLFILGSLPGGLAQVTTQFIIGGMPVDITERPYQAKMELDGGHWCGCSIVNREWLVTAAHCVQNIDLTRMRFRVGANSVRDGGTLIRAQSVIIHPDWNRATVLHDVAVIRLASALNFNARIQPIRLDVQEPLPGTDATVSGWGRTENAGQSEVLLEVDLNIITRAVADQRIAQFFRWPSIDQFTIAAASSGTDLGSSCNGDSGGPLTTLDRNGNTSLTGIVSWALTGGCPGDEPSFYANIAPHRNWILNNTCLANDNLDYSIFNDLQPLVSERLTVNSRVDLAAGTQSEFRAGEVIRFVPGAHIVSSQTSQVRFRTGNTCDDNIVELKMPIADQNTMVSKTAEDIGVVLTPNPAHDRVIVSWGSNSDALSATFFGGNGAKLQEFTNISSSQEFDLSNYPSGVLSVRIILESGAVVSKLLIHE